MNHAKFTERISLLFFLLFLVSQFGCNRGPLTDKDHTVALIGNRQITLDEFIMRAEYTPRPAYCKGSTNSDKQIILNSFVAEKLMALDNEKYCNEKMTAKLKKQLKGRLEQAMRIEFFKDISKNFNDIDEKSLSMAVSNVNREYDVDIFKTFQKKRAFQLSKQLKVESSIEEIMNHFSDVALSKENIQWKNNTDWIITESLFFEKVVKGEVKGPIQSDSGHWLVFQINGWKSTVRTQSELDVIIADMKKFHGSVLARKKIKIQVSEIMQNRLLKFNDDVFRNYAEMLKPVYFKSGNKMIASALWEDFHESHPSLETDSIGESVLFTLNNEPWTVSTVEELILTHPLVFRGKVLNEDFFDHHLRFALADLMRDYYVTKHCYERGYDSRQSVSGEYQLWFDNYCSGVAKFKYLVDSGVTLEEASNAATVHKHLSGYIESLQQKYSDQIYINIDLLKDIEITTIDMFVHKQGLPYAVPVPPFPILTADSRLDYGNILK